MDKFGRFIVCCQLVLICLVWLTEGCGRGSIKIQNNGYKDVLIAIGDKVPENPTLIDKIKEVFTEASALLYTATNKRAYFEEISILVPTSWDSESSQYAAAGKESFDKADIIVDLPSSQNTAVDRPFTVKNTPCGEPGHVMFIPPDFFIGDNSEEAFGPHDKVIVHEWSHLRYGVFDEYPSGSMSQFYADTGGVIEGVRCSKDITGRMFDKVTLESCSYNGNLPDSNCVYVDNESDDTGSGFASLMYKSFLDQVSVFCDSKDKTGSKTRHNSNAPTDQNRKCDGRSVWDVLNDHPDFANGTNLPREVADTTPTFRVIQPKTFKTVLVLDRSGSMGFDNRLKKMQQGCYNYITSIIRDGAILGIVQFNHIAEVRKSLTVISNETRPELVASLPTLADGSTSIGAGILEALSMLNNDTSTTGGSIIVLTDGEENKPPLLVDITDQVEAAEVTIHSIAITEAADSKLDLLATLTGGLSFIYSGSNTSNAINEAFQRIGELNSVDPTERSYVVSSEIYVISDNEPAEKIVAIDSSLGRSLQFSFDFSGSSITAKVTSPSGVEYQISDTNTAGVTHDTSFGIYHFVVTSAEAGVWQYQVTSSDEQELAVTVKAQSSESGEYPITASVHWGKSTIESIAPNQVNPKQELYASVSKGFNPVLNAFVEAKIERPDGAIIPLVLHDDGAGTDAFAQDGIYSGYFTQFEGQGRYGVKVKVGSETATVISPTKIIGRPVASRFDNENTDQEESIPVSNVTREETGQSFQLQNFTAAEGGKYYLPDKISNLDVLSASFELRMVSLQWTAVGDQLDIGNATGYDIRMGTDFQQMSTNFSGQIQVTQDMITSSGNLSQPLPAGQQEVFNITVPSAGSVTYIFAVKALDTDGRNVAGPISNIVSASLQNFETQTPEVKDGLSKAAIAIVAVGAILAVATVITAVVVISMTGSKYGLFKPAVKPLHNMNPKTTPRHFITPRIGHSLYRSNMLYSGNRV